MISRSWQYISCHWDTCSNHSTISDFKEMYCYIISEVWGDFSHIVLSDRLMHWQLIFLFNSYSASRDNWCTATLWNRIMTAQCEGMGEVGSARYEPALLPPCPSIRVLSYSNCQEIHSRQQTGLAVEVLLKYDLDRSTTHDLNRSTTHPKFDLLMFELMT